MSYSDMMMQVLVQARATETLEHPSGAMAAPDINTEEGRKELVGRLDPDFQGLLERKELSEMTQARLGQANCKSLSRFASLADTRAQLRTFLENTLRITAAAEAMEVAGLVDAWEAAKVRMEVRHKAEAEAASASMPMTLPKVEVRDLKRKFEATYYAIDDKVTPAPSTIEILCDQIENGEFKVMLITQFLSRDDAEVEPVGAVIDRTGSVKIRKGYGETKEPKTSEELRQRVRVLGHGYVMCGIKYPQRAVFHDLEPQDFVHYVDYLLGDQVYNLKSEDEHGSVVSTPTLKLVLSYEHQLRKEVTKRMNSGTQMKQALEDVRKDTSIKERYLLTPMSLSALTAMHPPAPTRSRSPRGSGAVPEPLNPPRRVKGEGKGKKGKDKSLHSKTPDGKEICFKWNSMKERCRYNCGRVHVCMRCLGSHPLHMCTKGRGKDTAGDGSGAEPSR